MPAFSGRSAQRLKQCHPELQLIFNQVVLKYDCVILCGHRGEAEQTAAFESGKSKTPWPKSKHNATPSLAVDVAPSPLDWSKLHEFYLFAGYVLGVAEGLGIRVRWGGDWDGDKDIRDQKFNDLVHFELVGSVDPINPPT